MIFTTWETITIAGILLIIIIMVSWRGLGAIQQTLGQHGTFVKYEIVWTVIIVRKTFPTLYLSYYGFCDYSKSL